MQNTIHNRELLKKFKCPTYTTVRELLLENTAGMYVCHTYYINNLSNK